MKRLIGLKLVRLMAVLAIAVQTVLPGVLAVAEPHNLNVSSFICVPSGEFSPKSQKAVEDLIALLGDELPDDEPMGEHCPLCTLAQTAPLWLPVDVTAPQRPSVATVFVRYDPGLFHDAQGPPLGSRGPPSYI